MTERDPFELLAALAHEDEHPDDDFAARLESELVEQLLAPSSTADGRFRDTDVIELEDTMLQQNEDRRAPRWLVPAIAAVAALVVAGIVWLQRDEHEAVVDRPPATSPESDEVRTSSPTTAAPTTAPPTTALAEAPLPPPLQLPPVEPAVPPPTSFSVDLARTLVDTLGGTDGLLLGSVVEDVERALVTFDPNNPDRALGGTSDWTAAVRPVLWEIDADGITAAPFNEASGRFGGVFQRDGSVAEDEADELVDTQRFVSDAAGNDLATSVAGFAVDAVHPSEGDRTFVLVTAVGGGCPFSRLTLGTPDRNVILDDQMNAYSRVTIVEPGVGLAFNRLELLDECGQPEADGTTAWDLATGEPLPDHPLAGRDLGWAAMSGDGSRAIVIDGQGLVTVLDLPSGDVVREIGTISARHVYAPLVLNYDGSIAITISDDGTATVWHVDSGEIIVELTSDSRPYESGVPNGPQTTASASYDATRLATLDLNGEEPAWSFYTLDPNEWLTRACAAGFEISDEERIANGFDPSVECSAIG